MVYAMSLKSQVARTQQLATTVLLRRTKTDHVHMPMRAMTAMAIAFRIRMATVYVMNLKWQVAKTLPHATTMQMQRMKTALAPMLMRDMIAMATA